MHARGQAAKGIDRWRSGDYVQYNYIFYGLFMIGLFCGGPLYGPTGRQEICKSEKPVLHREPSFLKNLSFKTCDFKLLKTVAEP
jgi:hypothetical protein